MHSSTERALWLARCVLPHEPALRAWLARKNLPGIEVDDIIHDTYARLSGLSSVEGIRDPKTYMFQTANSIIVSLVRRSRIVPILAVEYLEALEVPSDAPDPETQINDRQELQRLAAAIIQLPGKVRDVFVLRRIHGLSQREVAERLNIAESTVEKHMSRGFALIASLFDRGGNAPSRASSNKARDTQQSNEP